MRCRYSFLALAMIACAPLDAAVFSGPASSPSSGLSGSTVLIIRHAEKPMSGTGLTHAGQVRAFAYAKYFRNFHFSGAPLQIDTLVAASDTDNSDRPRLTLDPLSCATAMPVQQPFPSADVDGLARWLRVGPPRRTILIAWHHSEIGRLVAALGGDPRQVLPDGRWPSSVYDRVVVLQYDKAGAVVPSASGVVTENISARDPVLPQAALSRSASSVCRKTASAWARTSR